MLDDFFQDVTWAKSLTDDEYSLLLSSTKVKRFKKGSYVFHAGDLVEYWIGVMDGQIRLGSVSREGKVIDFTYVSSRAWFGEGSLLKCEPRKYDAVAARDSELAFISSGAFMHILDRSIPFNRLILNQLNERLGQNIAMRAYEQTLEPEARVGECLSQFYNKQLNPSTDMHLNISQQAIAQLCGLSRQRVNGALRALEAQGCLKVNFGSVTIMDVEKLRDLAVGV